MSSVLTVDPGAVREVRRHGSAARLVVADCTDRTAALAALALAHDDLYAVPHPLEPDAPLPNHASVEDTDQGPLFWFDIQDEGPAYAERIVGFVVDRLREAGVGGVLRAGRDPDGDADEDDESAEAPPVVREWSMGRPPVPWPTELVGPSGAPPSMVIGCRRHGQHWLLAHWSPPGPPRPDDVVAAMTAAGWSVTAVTGADELDPDVVGPFSDAGDAPGLRLWRAERDGWPVVVGSAPSADGWVLRLTTPVGAVPTARSGAPTPESPWPPGFPADLPPVTELARPPATTTVPGPDGAPWQQVQWLRRRPGHATDVVEALAAGGWTLKGADDRAAAALQATAAGRRGGVGSDDVRGWNASRGEQERLFVVSFPVPGAGALLVVSTPAG